MNKLTVEDLKITLQMRLAEVDRRIQLGRCETIKIVRYLSPPSGTAWDTRAAKQQCLTPDNDTRLGSRDRPSSILHTALTTVKVVNE